MKEVIHFKSQEDRMAYLKGGFEEITPKKVTKTATKVDSDSEIAEKTQKKGIKIHKIEENHEEGSEKG